jgi:hypothetical protein
MASPPFHDAKLASNAESKPRTMEGWTLHGVTNGAAILEGPNGIWRVKRGEHLPGIGSIRLFQAILSEPREEMPALVRNPPQEALPLGKIAYCGDVKRPLKRRTTS